MEFYLSLFIAFIGACAWIPILIEMLKKPKLIGSIESLRRLEVYEYEHNLVPSYLKKLKISIYLLNVKLVVLNSDYITKKIELEVKMHNSNKLIKGTLFYNPEIYYKMENMGAKLDIKLSDTLIGKAKFEKNELNLLSNTIYFETAELLDIEYVDIKLISYKDKILNRHLFISETKDYINNDDVRWQEKRLV